MLYTVSRKKAALPTAEKALEAKIGGLLKEFVERLYTAGATAGLANSARG